MQRITAAFLVLPGSIALAGCELVEGIFKVGFWAGVILVALVILAIWLIIRLLR